LVNGRAFKPTEWEAQGVPIVRIQNLNNASARYNYFQGDLDERHRLNGGELLFAWSGTPGTSFGAHIWKGGAAALNQHIFRVDFDSSLLDKRFFRFAINERLNDLIGVAQGGVGLRHVTKGVFEETEILVPPRPEQTRIADKLDSLLARIQACQDRLEAIPALLKRFRQTVLSAATSGELTENGASAPRLVELRSALAEPLRNGKSVRDGDGLPVLRLTCLKQTGIALNETKTGDWTGVPNVRRFLIQDGDYLVSRGNGSKDLVGRGGLVAGCTRDIAFPDTMIRIRPDTQQLLPDYLKYIWGAPFVRRQIEQSAKTTAGIWKVSQPDLERVELPVPSIKEQAEIVQLIDGLMQLANRIEFRLAVAMNHAQRLEPLTLSKAFRGELVPQVPSDEPASALLSRISAEHIAPARVRPPRSVRAGRPPRAPKGTATTTKSRQDDDVMGQPYLAGHLRRLDTPISAEALFKVAELPVADFYKQLAWEVSQGHVKDNQTTLEPGHAAG
jgi:type I restriction enzyme S subunit